MPSQPEDREHRGEESAALLLGASYSLPQLIRATKARPRPFRRIETTEALRADLAAPYFDLLRAWEAERAELLAAYARLLPADGAPLGADAAATMRSAVDGAAARVEAARLERQFSAALTRLDRWYRIQWLARIRAATGLKVDLLTSERAGAAEVSNAVVRNEQLLASLHDETRGRVGAMLTSALMARVAVESVGTAFSRGVDQGKPRAARIAVDQTDMLSETLSRVRRREAGLARFRWHHTRQPRPREEHLARDGRVYTHSNAPNDRAGTLPFCKCWEEPLFD